MKRQKPNSHSQVENDEETISLEKILTEHNQALIEHQTAVAAQTSDITAQELPPKLQRVVQVLCETYEALDLRIETTVGAAEADFLAALPELEGHEDDLRELVALLMADFRTSIDAKIGRPVMLRFAYQDRGDLVEQLLTGSKARLVVVQADDAVSIHANIKGHSI